MSNQTQQVNLKLKGLYTSANDFSGVPEGALDVADNCVIDYDELIEPRRGFEALSGSLPSVSDRINQFTTYQDKLIYHYGASSLGYYNSGFNAYSGTFSPPDSNTRSRFMTANQNLYVSTSTGVRKLSAYNGTPAAAGVAKGLDVELTLTGSSGFFEVNEVAAVTGNTATSVTLSQLSDVSEIAVGQYVSGSGVTAGTTVSAVATSAVVRIATGDTTAGTATISNITGNSGITTAGVLVTGTGIPSGTRIVSIAGGGPYTLTISNAPTITATAATYTFYSDPTVTLSAATTATATGVALSFSDGSQVAYRCLFGIRDANNNLIYGAPSQFASIINNQGASRNVIVKTTIPSGITTSHFVQIYRSPQTASASVNPQDEEQLVYEATVTSTDITNGYISVTDSTPDSLRGAYLYTSASQEGIAQQNDQPPYCKDFCNFKGFGIYANVKTKQRKKLTILSTVASTGITAGDTITIAGVVFTANSTETISTGNFKVYTSGTPAQNIYDTTNSLIRVINRYATNTATYAYLLSGPSDLPGQILLEERSIGGASFAIIASAHGTAYNPALPTSGTTVSSAVDTYLNGIMISKENEPEAVPEANLLFAGSASSEILRVIPLREYVAICTQAGIFRLTGVSLSTFVIQPFDLTTRLTAPDTAIALTNEVWGLFDQGVCSISDTGVNVRSRAIETDLRQLTGTALDTVIDVAFGIGYETDRKYILALPNAEGDTACQQQYVFNTFTNAWTRWTRSCTAGIWNDVDDKLYLGSGSDNTVSSERKTNTYQDYVDESFAVTISSSSSYSVVLSSISGIEVGDVLYKSSTVASVITAITPATNTVTVQDLLTWGTGSATILVAIETEVQWKPVVAGNPAYVRQYSEGAVVFKRTRFNEATVSAYTDQSPAIEDTTLEGTSISNWGVFVWGGAPWGGSNRSKSIRFLLPQNKQIASQLTLSLAIRAGYSKWGCEGISVSFNEISQAVGD